MFTKKKIAIVSVTNDLSTDVRVAKTCSCLIESNFEVILVGRKLKKSLPLQVLPWQQKRLFLLFKSGPAFYFFYNLRLFFYLLFKKADLYFSNDLDTLFPNYLVSKIKNKPLIYDSHELFCEVPELLATPYKKKIWQKLEKAIVPKLKYCITVNQSIATIFEDIYKVKFNVVRNISEPVKLEVKKNRVDLNLPVNKKIIILQGAGINVDRGAEELIEAMLYIDNVLLLIIGSGDVWENLKQLVIKFKLNEKIKMIYKIPKIELMQYTINSDLGITLDKNTNKNYYNSLPNKVFDYLNAGIPILTSPMPEIEAIVKDWHVGKVVNSYTPVEIAKAITDFLNADDYLICKQNTKNAAKAFSWQDEKQVLIEVINSAST